MVAFQEREIFLNNGDEILDWSITKVVFLQKNAK